MIATASASARSAALGSTSTKGTLVGAQVGIGDAHLGAELHQPARHRQARRGAGVGGVALVGEPEQQHLRAPHGLAHAVQRVHQAAHHVVGHGGVDVVGELDEAERAAEVAAHGPRQVARVDGQAVAADAGTGGEAHVPEGLGRRGVDRLPHVDPEVRGEHRQLVHQGDVHVAEGVLEELRELGHPVSPIPARSGPRAGRRSPAPPSNDASSIPDTTLGMVTRFHVRVAGVDALGAVAEMEVGSGAEPRALLEDGGHQLFGRPRVGRGLEHHRGAGAQVPAHHAGRLLDVRQVGVALGRAAWARR